MRARGPLHLRVPASAGLGADERVGNGHGERNGKLNRQLMANSQRNGQRNGHLCPLPGRLLLSARRWARGVLSGHLLPGSLDEQLDSVPGRVVLHWRRRSARNMPGGPLLAPRRLLVFELLCWHFLQRRRDEQFGGVSEGLVLPPAHRACNL